MFFLETPTEKKVPTQIDPHPTSAGRGSTLCSDKGICVAVTNQNTRPWHSYFSAPQESMHKEYTFTNSL